MTGFAKSPEAAKQRVPAECFPPEDFIRDELVARGWTIDDLCSRMPAQSRSPRERYSVERMTALLNGGRELDYFDAAGLGRAFGTSRELWIGIADSYKWWMEAKGK